MKIKKKSPTLDQMVEAARKEGATVTVGLKPKLLFDCVHTRVDTYQYRVDAGPSAKETGGAVTITFLDGKFQTCSFPMNGSYSRVGWHILEAINDKIGNLEHQHQTEI